MSAYSDWRCGAISDDEYKFAYNHDRGEDHGIIDDLPFYTDDADDPYWQCENCAKCETCSCGEEICDQFEEREE